MNMLTRWRRSCGFDTNDLRRDVDRVQWRIGLVLLMLFLSVTPPLTFRAAQAVYDSGMRSERQEAAAWQRVNVTVTKTEALRTGHRVTVTWTEPDGTRRTGDFTTRSRIHVGEQMQAWAGPGTVSPMAPNWHGRTVASTMVAGTGVVLAVGLPLFGVYRLMRRRYDRRRDRLWDTAWARLDNHRIGP